MRVAGPRSKHNDRFCWRQYNRRICVPIKYTCDVKLFLACLLASRLVGWLVCGLNGVRMSVHVLWFVNENTYKIGPLSGGGAYCECASGVFGKPLPD